MAKATLFDRIADAKQGVSSDFDSYVSSADSYMLENFGLKYSEAEFLLNPDKEAIKVAFDEGVPVADFVNQLSLEHGLIDVNDPRLKGGDVASHNRVATAISDFVAFQQIERQTQEFLGFSEQGLWHRREGGVICMETQDGFAILRPVLSQGDNSFGFGIEVREGGVLSQDGFSIADLGKRGARFASFELADVIEEFAASKKPGLAL